MTVAVTYGRSIASLAHSAARSSAVAWSPDRSTTRCRRIGRRAMAPPISAPVPARTGSPAPVATSWITRAARSMARAWLPVTIWTRPGRLPVQAEQRGDVLVGQRRTRRPQLGRLPDDPAVHRRVVLVLQLEVPRRLVQLLVQGLAVAEQADDVRAAQPVLVALAVEHAEPDHLLHVPLGTPCSLSTPREKPAGQNISQYFVQVLGRERVAGIGVQAAAARRPAR